MVGSTRDRKSRLVRNKKSGLRRRKNKKKSGLPRQKNKKIGPAAPKTSRNVRRRKLCSRILDHIPIESPRVLGSQSPQHQHHRLLILSSMMFPCIIIVLRPTPASLSTVRNLYPLFHDPSCFCFGFLLFPKKKNGLIFFFTREVDTEKC